MAAVRNGVSIDTTMGFSPLEGLIMATRTGDVDPTVIQFLVNEHGFDVDDVFSVLNNESGLAGLSGIGEDMRKILRAREEGNERAALAIDAFTYRIKKYIGAYTAVLDDVDGIVFTAGIGENAAPIRERSCDIPTLDVVVDKEANETTQSERAIISAAESAVPVAVIPTDEELMIARETARIVSEMS
jgi:acetate kinase